MTITAIVLLILLGIALILVEFLVIPGVTVAGVLGTLLILGGVFCGYYFHATPNGHYILGGSVLSLVFIFTLAFKTKTWQRFGLENSIDGHVGQIDETKVKQGDSGKTISRLTPIGKAMINDEVFEVRSNGQYIDSGSEVTVLRIGGNKIYVELKQS